MSSEASRSPATDGPVADDGGTAQLRDLVDLLRRRKLSVVASVLVGLLLALGFTLTQETVYAATAEVLIEQRSTAAMFDPSIREPVYPERVVQNELEFVRSAVVEDAAEERLGRKPRVTASTARNADLLSITAHGELPEQAAETANVYAETYIDLKREAEIDAYLTTGEVLQTRISELDQQLRRLPQTSDERQAILSQRTQYQQRLDSLLFSADVAQGGGARLIDRADEGEPISPTPIRNMVLGLAVGLMLGVGVALARDHFDDTLKTKEALERASGGLTTLAVIAVDPGWKKRDQPRLILQEDPSSVTAEGYRSLRTSLQFSSLDHPIRVLQLTSPTPGDGKSTVAANLGVAMARAGLDVLLVSLDMHRPRLHTFFGLSNSFGFTSLVLGTLGQEQAIQFVPREDGLRVLAAGSAPPNPSELLTFDRTARVLSELRDAAEFVIIDSPPVLPVSDSMVISRFADATALVASVEHTSVRDVHRAIELLSQVRAPLIGTVLNRVEMSGRYAYRYGEAPAVEEDVVGRRVPGAVDWDEVTSGGSLRRVAAEPTEEQPPRPSPQHPNGTPSQRKPTSGRPAGERAPRR